MPFSGNACWNRFNRNTNLETSWWNYDHYWSWHGEADSLIPSYDSKYWAFGSKLISVTIKLLNIAFNHGVSLYEHWFTPFAKTPSRPVASFYISFYLFIYLHVHTNSCSSQTYPTFGARISKWHNTENTSCDWHLKI